MKTIKIFSSSPNGVARFIIRLTLLFTLLGVEVLMTACSYKKDPSIKTEPSPIVSQAETVVPDPPASSSASDVEKQTAATAASEISDRLDLETAKQTALLDAGVRDSDVTYKKAELDYDDRNLVYEIEFYTATHDYEYEIDAVSGEIRHREHEVHHIPGSGHHAPGGVAASPSEDGSDIGLEAAQAIAVEHAGVSASEIVFTKAKQEYEDGRLIYEIEFWKDRMEYEYEIDALSGDILKADSDYDD